MPSINLKYATNNHGFFSNIDKIKTILSAHKQENDIATFDIKDESEIGRGQSYAVFPELKQGQKITVQSFRKSLEDRGVVDPEIQNKILNLILQNKAGVHYAMGNVINFLLLEKGFDLLMNAAGYTIELEVNGPMDVDLVFKAEWDNFREEPREASIAANVKINITPNSAAITDFTLTKLADSTVANSAFEFLQDNQQNILMKLITLIKHALGFNSELRIEQSNENDNDWVNTPVK
jgi:hypothetical protein